MSTNTGYAISFSYTMLDTYANCPESMRQIYILKTFKKTFTPQITGGVDVHAELDKRIKTGKPPATMTPMLAAAEPFIASLARLGPLESEASLAVDHWLNPAGFWNSWLRGKFDLVVRVPEKRKAILGDWKTGKVREKADQLEIGAVLLMATDPAIDSVTGFNIWLATGKLGEPYTFARRSDSAARLVKKIRDIEALDPRGEWPRRDGPLCAYCPVKSCQHYRGG